MKKRLLSFAVMLSLVLSFAVVPTYAATFSSDNWVQYERGFKYNTSDFNNYFEEYADTSYGDEQLTGLRMVAKSTKTLTADKEPVEYYWNPDSFEEGVSNATYAHIRVYVATFSDAYRNGFDFFQLRMTDASGNKKEAFVFDTYKPEGSDEYVSEAYAKSYGGKDAYITKDYTGVLHQGKLGNGPVDTADSHERILSDSDYDKIDVIAEYNKQSGANFYLFANGKFMGTWYVSGITNKHFNGMSFRVTKDRKLRGNSDYIAVKFDSDRIGHREYYNTDSYMVTLEDVLTDAGLGDDIDSTMIYKTKADALEWYMPGNEQKPFIYAKDATERKRINEKVTYSGTAATITVTNTDSENYELAARMIAGFYPLIGKHGIAYESYHPRAKFIKLSFDQTLSNDGMWVEYATHYSGQVRAMQMWNNEGKLVVGIKGGKNETCSGEEGKPLAEITGTNHIDWILEPVDGECVKQYVFVNGVFAGRGAISNEYAVRINDIVIGTMKAEGTITIDNWSMTVYNDTMTLDDFGVPAAVEPESVTLGADEISLEVGDTYTLTASVEPQNAEDKSVNWTSSDETVATVSGGVVTAVAEGTATITATTKVGGKTAECAVTVVNATVTILYGDVNKDGKVTLKDDATLARYLAKWEGYDETTVDLAAADVNGDSKVTLKDNGILARHIAKWIGYETLPYIQ